MFIRTLLITIFLSAIGIIEHTFFAALMGGIWYADMLLAFASARMTAVRGPGVWSWILVASVLTELFSHRIFGATLLGTLIGLTVTRIASYSLFSHRSFFARTSAMLLGILTAVFTTALLLVLFFFAVGTPASVLHPHSLVRSVHTVIATSLLSVLLLGVLSSLEPRLRWIFRNRSAQAMRIPYE